MEFKHKVWSWSLVWLCAAASLHAKHIRDVKTYLPGDYSKVEFVYFKNSLSSFLTFSVADACSLHEVIDRLKPTVFYIHGYLESQSSESVQVVIQAFLNVQSHNIILVDWSAYAKILYTTAYENVPRVGEVVANVMNCLVQCHSIDSDTLWPIGHSLGAQMAGAVAKHVSFMFRRISGLDPAGPGYILPRNPLLTSSSARFVDVIHTDAGALGYDRCDGTLDFWPNGGFREQPGCPLQNPGIINEVACSHQRSWRYFAESVGNVTAFPAVLCSSWIDFLRGSCPPSSAKDVYLGFNAPEMEKGSAFLLTGSSSPYGLGSAGAYPNA